MPGKLLEVGKPYSPNRASWPEVVEYNYHAGQHELRLFLGHLSHEDVDDITKGPCEFGVFVAGDIIFLLYRFGDAIPWSDAPYSIHLVSEAERTIPEPPPTPESRDLLTVILVEATNGIVRGLRVVSLSPELTRLLRREIVEQAEREWPGQAEYDRQLAAVYRQYPAPAMMMPLAKGVSVGGE